MALRIVVLFILFMNMSVTAAQSKGDDEWNDICFEDNCPPPTIPKKTSAFSKILAKTATESYEMLKEKFMERKISFQFVAGGYRGSHGEAQLIPVTGLIGDYFSVNHFIATGGVVGLSLYMESLAWDNDVYRLQYGVSSFFLSKTSVQGLVTQENLVTNISYKYNLYNFPSYWGVKITRLFENSRRNLTFDLGLGFNQIKTDLFYEQAMTYFTLPDEIFAGGSSYDFSATIGFGVKQNNTFGKFPLECGYRFFYLGRGELKPINDLVITPLSTGRNYVNAVMCGVEIG
jgi:hypothetical protein